MESTALTHFMGQSLQTTMKQAVCFPPHYPTPQALYGWMWLEVEFRVKKQYE